MSLRNSLSSYIHHFQLIEKYNLANGDVRPYFLQDGINSQMTFHLLGKF